MQIYAGKSGIDGAPDTLVHYPDQMVGRTGANESTAWMYRQPLWALLVRVGRDPIRRLPFEMTAAPTPQRAGTPVQLSSFSQRQPPVKGYSVNHCVIQLRVFHQPEPEIIALRRSSLHDQRSAHERDACSRHDRVTKSRSGTRKPWHSRTHLFTSENTAPKRLNHLALTCSECSTQCCAGAPPASARESRIEGRRAAGGAADGVAGRAAGASDEERRRARSR